MKLNKFLQFGLGLLTVASFASCDDYEETADASPLSDGDGAAFNATSQSITILPTDDAFVIELHRLKADGAATYGVEVLQIDTLSNDELFCTPPASVSFAAGEKSTSISVPINKNCSLQQEYSLSLALQGVTENWYSSGSAEASFAVTIDYTWLSAGSCTMTSGWAGASATVAIQKAKEANGLYRLVSPYYVLEPEYCKEAGYHIQFYLDEDYNAVKLAPVYQNIGEDSSYGGWWWLTWSASSAACSFTNTGNVYSIAGFWAYGEAGAQSLADYASESFVWDNGFPGTLAPEIDYTIAAGAKSIDSYVGTYSASYTSASGPVTEAVAISKIDDSTVSIEFTEYMGIALEAKYVGGLLYVEPQSLGMHYITSTLVKEVTAYLYNSAEETPVRGGSLVAGFNADGQLVFTSPLAGNTNDGLFLAFFLQDGDIDGYDAGMYAYDMLYKISMTPDAAEAETVPAAINKAAAAASTPMNVGARRLRLAERGNAIR